MKSIFNNEAYQEINARLEQLTAESHAKWGKMNVNQMLAHCQGPIQVSLGEMTMQKPPFLKGIFLKLISSALYNDKPWKQGLPTAKEFVHVSTEEFLIEKQKLSDLIDKIHNSKSYFDTPRTHPYFGKFTAEQWGKAAYKHLDHHFTQFGV